MKNSKKFFTSVVLAAILLFAVSTLGTPNQASAASIHSKISNSYGNTSFGSKYKDGEYGYEFGCWVAHNWFGLKHVCWY